MRMILIGGLVLSMASAQYVPPGGSGGGSGISGLTTGKVAKAASSSTVADSTCLSESGSAVSFGSCTATIGTRVPPTGHPAGTVSASCADVPGPVNVTCYGAVPDGSTDNSTAIAAAFAVSNAFTVGIPTVYFPCNAGTVCQYNYGGSGTSPINPTIPTTIECDPGAALNYTGSAHVADIGPAGLGIPTQQELPYLIKGCEFTGAVSSTQGIYVNAYVVNSNIIGNTFHNFGNRTGYNIIYAGNNWEGRVGGNWWYDDDGFTRNILDAHASSVNALRITDNFVECSAPLTPFSCSISSIGVGFWVGGAALVTGNTIQYHGPNVRIANYNNNQGDRVFITHNYFEGNVSGTVPLITYGDPGGTSAGLNCNAISYNTFHYQPATGVPVIGSETPASSIYTLSHCQIDNNLWSVVISSGTYYVYTHGGNQNLWGMQNYNGNTRLTSATVSPGSIDVPNAQLFVSAMQRGAGEATANGLTIFQADGQNTTVGGFHNVSASLVCPDSSGSGTTQVCRTTPWTEMVNGNAVPPVAGDMIVYKTTTTNTGALTIAVNNLAAKEVRKNAGITPLSAGDLKAGVYYPLVYDGTYFEMQSNNTVVPTSCTGLPTGGLWNNAGTAAFCP